MKIKRDQITGLALILVGVVFAVLISQFKTPFTPEYPGPKLLPGIGVFGLIVCGLGVFVNGCRQQEPDKVVLTASGLVRVVITFAILCAYILLMKFLGFLIVTPFVVFGITYYFSKASSVEIKLWVNILFSLAVTFIIWGMYVLLFGMTLPTGQIFG